MHKQLTTLLILSCLVLAGCKEENKHTATYLLNNGGVDQSVEKSCPIGENFSNPPCIMTCVWFNGEIAWHSYTPTTADSTTIKRQLDIATVIFNNLKSINK